MKRSRIKSVIKEGKKADQVMICGWVRTRRDSKEFSFLEINDGSCLMNIQVIADSSLVNYDEIIHLSTGSSVTVEGLLVESPGKGQNIEIKAEKIGIIGKAADDYPLQKKRHSEEFLRSIAHLRPRTNRFGAMFRIRSEIAIAIHNYFREKGFCYLHTPIITGSDCEGAGEMFRITCLDKLPSPDETGKKDFSADFFGKETNLTVSGQLEAELFALALGDVYTFGPTFRAENSNTSRHAAEFWMVEPEMAFCDLAGDMELAEDFLKYLIRFALEKCHEDLDIFSKFVDENLKSHLEAILNQDFIRLPYKEAVKILIESGKTFDFKPEYGKDLQSEHERFLTGDHFKGPVIVYNYPKTIKPFYMRVNDDNETVAAMDVLVPRIGEIIGGSQREERLDILEKRMDGMGMNKEEYWWYLDSRKYGSVPHSGFGMGFERFLMLLTGTTNIRDVIPFPRTPGNVDF
ncbi:asparagine--tRNA ligase [Desulforegula conservatrix]|uniref:asparagine--tRNA ligase n=1 Tax=Desulforegula conservatrix TaxID=153026 RepID=UPI0003FF48B4|nr:asparagine--tRNA ligase [Desulforegula conservatrix]